MNKVVHTSGKRKRAIARATLTEGKGNIKVNKLALDHYSSKLIRMKIAEPLLIADKAADKIDIAVKVQGGGVMAQAEAVRLAVARGLLEYTKSKELKQLFLDYDRQLLVADVRRKEVCKPNDSKARAKRQKSYR